MSDANPKPPDQRKSARTPLSYRAVCRTETGRTVDVWLSNISEAGCRVEFRRGHLLVDDILTVEIAGLERISAVVRWSGAGTAGLKFSRALKIDVLDQLIRRFAV